MPSEHPEKADVHPHARRVENAEISSLVEALTRAIARLTSLGPRANSSTARLLLDQVAALGIGVKSTSAIRDVERRRRMIGEQISRTVQTSLQIDAIEPYDEIRIENRITFATFTVLNHRDAPRDGWVTGKIVCSEGCEDPSSEVTLGYYDLTVLPYSSTVGVISFIAPPAGSGHRIELVYYDKGTDPSQSRARDLKEFDTAGRYAFKVERVVAIETRSLSVDTLVVAYGITTPRTNPSQAESFKTVKNGDELAIQLTPVIFSQLATSDVVIPWYGIANMGKYLSTSEAGELASNISAGLGPAGIFASLAIKQARENGTYSEVGAQVGIWLGGIFTGVLWTILYQAFLHSCDGPVAQGNPEFVGSDLELQTRGGAKIARTEKHMGSDSPIGCGANSIYEVSYFIERTRRAPVLSPPLTRVRSGESVQFSAYSAEGEKFADFGAYYGFAASGGAIDKTGLFTAPVVSEDTLVSISCNAGVPNHALLGCYSFVVVSPVSG